MLRPSLSSRDSKQPIHIGGFTRAKPLDCDHGDVTLHSLPHPNHLIREYKGIGREGELRLSSAVRSGCYEKSMIGQGKTIGNSHFLIRGAISSGLCTMT